MQIIRKNSVFGVQNTGSEAQNRAVCQRNATDYSPFGVSLDGRTIERDFYRRGFNGMEKDDEVKGSGNSYDFGARMYDSRVGRWLTIDPLASKYPAIGPYVISLNSPLLFKDPNGEDAVVTVQKNENGGGTITISSIVYITGNGASPVVANELTTLATNIFKEGIYKAEDGDYKVVFDVKYQYVSDKSMVKLSDGENSLDLTMEKGRSSVPYTSELLPNKTGYKFITGTAGVINWQPKGFWRFSVLHETLHLLGLFDRYDENDIDKIPDEGFRKDIMGRHGAKNISQVHYDNYGKKFAGKESGTFKLNEFVDLDKHKNKIGTNDDEFSNESDQELYNQAKETYGEPNP